MFCKQCGNQLTADAKFCGKCGTAVTDTTNSSTSNSVPSAPVSAAAQPVPASKNASGLSDFGDIFQSAWNNFTSKFGKLLLLEFLMFVPMIIIGIIIGIGVVLKVDFQNTTVMVVGIALGFVALIALIYWFIWTQAAMIQMLLDNPVRGIRETLNFVKPKLRNYFLASLLSGLIVLGGFILLIIPAFIFGVMYIYSSYISLVEDKGAVESVKRSRLYVKGRFWAVTGRFVLFFVIYLGASIMVGVIDAILGLREAQVFSNIFSFLATPFTVAFFLAMYLDTKKAAGEVTVV